MAFTKPDQILEIRSPFFGIRSPFLEFVRIRNESQLRGIRIPKRAYEFVDSFHINSTRIGLPPAFSEKASFYTFKCFEI